MFQKLLRTKLTTALFLNTAMAVCMYGQTTGSIEGTVMDPTGAAIVGVGVTITNEQTRVATATITNSAGYFLADTLPSGTYRIEVSHPGFKNAAVSGVKLDIATRVRRDISLAVGDLAETVHVEASGAEVNTSDSTVSSTITKEQIGTAVLNGRHFSRLAMLVPGAVYSSGSDELSGAGLNATGSPVSINGLNNKSAGWFIDGAYNMNVGNGEANTHVPVIDSLEEVQVQTSNYSARYGTTGGAVITAVTKSGGSQFHGGAYEYLRNDSMDARNFFAVANPPLKQNQFGFFIGGPVLLPHYNKDRNKTFFFLSEDWRKRRNATTSLTATPSEALRQGNFQSEAARTGRPLLDPLTGQPFPNNSIPANRIDPNAALLMSTYFPLPNYSLEPFRNYLNNGVSKLDTRTDTGKLDHNLTDSIRFSFVLSNDAISVLSPDAGLAGSPFPVIRQQESTGGMAYNIRNTWTLSPRSVNEISYSAKKLNINLLLANYGADPTRPNGLNIRDFFDGANTLNQTPAVTFSQGWGGIGTNLLPLKPARDDNAVITDNFSHVAGNHTLQMGFSLFLYNKTQAAFNSTQGAFSFDGTFTNHPVGDFLLGMARTYTQGQERFVRTYKFIQTEPYFQDDWRISRRLTLNLGMRLFIIPLTHVEDNLMSSFLPSAYDPSKAPQINSAGVLVPTANYDPLNGIVLPEQNGVPRGFADTFWGVAPRFGFAYDPTGRGSMSIRGGYGISYLNSGTNQSALVNNPPFNQTVSLVNVPLSDPSGGTPNAPRPVALNAFNPAFQRPQVQSWSLSVQKELPAGFLGTVAYVGTRGTNWEVWIDRNSSVFGGAPAGYDFDPRLNTGFNENLIRPYVGYGSITQFNSGLNSTYHSLQTSFQRRFSKGLALQGSYTWSKALGQSQTRRDMRVQNPLDWSADRGVVDFDRTHVFTMNYIYELPFFRGKRGFVGQVVGNWQVSGLITAQSGLALTPGMSLSSRGLATRPDATGAPVAGAGSKESWFNTGAFAAPAPGMFGNAGVGTLRGPGFFIWDASVAKQFPVTENMRFSLRGELFNWMNHTNWSGVDTNLGSGTYGRVTSARDPRRIQVSARLDF
jgi:hypothetical protein